MLFYTFSLHDALPILPFPNGDKYNMLVIKSGEVMLSYHAQVVLSDRSARNFRPIMFADNRRPFVNDIQLNTDETAVRSEEHTSELHSRENLVCRLLLE